MGTMQLETAIAQFLEFAGRNNHPKTVAVYRHYLNRFLQRVSNRPLDSLTPAAVLSWSQKFHPVQTVQRLTRWASREARIIERNPLKGMRKPRCGTRRRILSEVESLALLRAARPRVRAFLLALRESWVRPGEIRGATWDALRTAGNLPASDADLIAGRGFLFIVEGKAVTRQADRAAVRVVPISPRLGRLIVRLRHRRLECQAEIFRNSSARSWSVNAVRCAVRRLRSKVGLLADWRGEKIVAYSWRHTAATAAVRAGVRDFRLAGVLGHASTRTTARYVHLQPADLAAAMESAKLENGGRRREKHRLGSLRNAPDCLG